MLNKCLSCVHFEDALVQLELNSVLDVGCGVELDTQLRVKFRLEVDWELFDIIVTAPLAHSRTHAHTWHPPRDWELTHYHPVSLSLSLTFYLSPTHAPTPSRTPSFTYSLAHPVSQSVQTLTD